MSSPRARRARLVTPHAPVTCRPVPPLSQDRWILGMCFVAYVIAWIPIWLLPFDLIGMEARLAERLRFSELHYDWLQFFWQIIYVTNLATGYLTYDFARSYLDVGGFTIRRRLHLAWVEIRVWYSWALLVVVAIIFALMWFTKQGGTWSL